MQLRQLKVKEICDIIMKSSNATCKLDPIPTWLVKLCVDELKTVITKIINMSLHYCYYRPLNNLSVVTKIAEKAVVGQIVKHCEENAPLSINQSAYRSFNSAEAALIKVQSDILMSMDQHKVTLLVLLDLKRGILILWIMKSY